MNRSGWKTMMLAAALAPAMMMTGCQSDGGGNADGGLILADPVALDASDTGDNAALASSGVLLIQSQAAYDAAGLEGIFAEGIDFDSNDLVVLALGERNTGGYAIRINSILLEGTTLVVNGVATAPPADAATTQALTYPYAAALIAKTGATSAIPYVISTTAE